MAKNSNSPATQARQAAFAAVPTRRSINQQYGQSIGDVEGFSKALLGLLQQGPGVGAGYSQAIQQQAGIDSAARGALAATGTPYAAGSAAAVGGLGASALSALNARGAAANQYGATLPHVAAARGQFGVQSLENARQQAITQRNQSYQQAYLQALGQARQNAFNQRIALADLGLKRQSLRMQNQQFNANQQYRYAALQQNQNQFRSSQALQWQEFQSKLATSIQNGSAKGLAGFTPNEISGLRQKAYDYVNSTAVTHGVPIQVAIRNLQAQGIPHTIAVYVASEGYATMTKPMKSEFVTVKSVRDPATGTYRNQTFFNKLGFQQATRAYQSSFRSLQRWLNQRQWQSQGLSPGNQRTREGRPS